jgi:hypothetical protein
MGNRGCLHDADGRIRRSFVGRRWIICLLQFKGRRRPIMAPGATPSCSSSTRPPRWRLATGRAWSASASDT